MRILTRSLFLAAALLAASSVGAGTQPVGVGINVNPCSNSAPTPTGTARYWTKCTPNHAFFTDASNVDHDLEAGSMSCVSTADCASGYICVSTICYPTMQSTYNAGYTAGYSVEIAADLPVSYDGEVAYPSPSPNPPAGCMSPGWDDLVFRAGNNQGPNFTNASNGFVFGLGVTGANEIVSFDPHVDGSCSGNQTQNWFQFFGGADTTLRVGKSRKGQFFQEAGELRIIGGDGADNVTNGFGSQGGGVWALGGLGGLNNTILGPQPGGTIIIDSGPGAQTSSNKIQPNYGTWLGVEAISIGQLLAPTVGIGHNDLSGNPATGVSLYAGTIGLSMYSLGRWFISSAQPIAGALTYWDTNGALSSSTEFVAYNQSVNMISPATTPGNPQGWLQVSGESLSFFGGAQPAFNTVLLMTPQSWETVSYDTDAGGKIAALIKTNAAWTAGTLLSVQSASQVRVVVESGPGTPLEVTGNFSGLGQIKIQDSGEGAQRGSGIVFTDTGSGGYLIGTSSTATSGNLYAENNGGSFAGWQMDTVGNLFPVNNIASQDLGKSGSPWHQLWLSGTVTEINGELTAGSGVTYPEKVGQSVVSAGGGAQSTSVVSFTPNIAGTYRVTLYGTCFTNNDTISATVSYTDADAGALTLTPVSSVACVAPNATATFTTLAHATTATAIAVTLTLSTFATTHMTATIEREN